MEKKIALVTEVRDGDSFATSSGEVRLADVDTPEKGALGYEAAKNALTDLIDGKLVDIMEVSTDTYGRTVAYVTVADGMGLPVDVNETMKQYE